MVLDADDASDATRLLHLGRGRVAYAEVADESLALQAGKGGELLLEGGFGGWKEWRTMGVLRESFSKRELLVFDVEAGGENARDVVQRRRGGLR